MAVIRRNIGYVVAFLLLFAFFAWILSKMASQTHGRTLIFMVGAMLAALLVLGVSARLFMKQVKCPECGKKAERGQGTCTNCGAELTGGSD